MALVTLQRYADIHGMTKSAVYMRVRRGMIKAVKRGRMWWIDDHEPMNVYRVRRHYRNITKIRERRNKG